MAKINRNAHGGRQGFASLDSERRKEIARMGGQAAQAKGVGHRFSVQEARQAGRKGGLARAAQRSTGGNAG